MFHSLERRVLLSSSPVDDLFGGELSTIADVVELPFTSAITEKFTSPPAQSSQASKAFGITGSGKGPITQFDFREKTTIVIEATSGEGEVYIPDKDGNPVNEPQPIVPGRPVTLEVPAGTRPYFRTEAGVYGTWDYQ